MRWIVAILLVMGYLVVPIFSASGDINCTKYGYKIKLQDSDDEIVPIFQIDPDDANVSVYINVFLDSNALGYSSTYKRFYATENRGENADFPEPSTGLGYQLVSIESNGTVTQVTMDWNGYDPVELGKIAMDIDPYTDRAYIRKRKKPEAWGVHLVDITGTNTAKFQGEITLQSNGNTTPGADWAINPQNRYLYFLQSTGTAASPGYIYVYDVSSASDGDTVDILNTYQLDFSNLDDIDKPTSDILAGSQWFDYQGRLYMWLNDDINNNGYALWRATFDDTNNKAIIELLGYSDVDGTGDGASCQSYTPNTPPVATDDWFEIVQGNDLTGNIVTQDNGNGIDSDPDGDSLIVISAEIDLDGDGNPDSIEVDGTPYGIYINGSYIGTISLNSDGTITFTPDPDFYGMPPVLTYTISDGHGGTDSANVYIKVLPDHDQDGYADIYDKDDDNDGIVDTNETLCDTFIKANFSDYAGVQPSSGVNDGNLTIGPTKMYVYNFTHGDAVIQIDEIAQYNGEYGIHIGNQNGTGVGEENAIETVIELTDLIRD
ncbi:MAG: hypothetical protein GXO16_02435, partial [Epsilonproteobacteria bacterium]|nr:hypothetical protein [Campylobacterota bacterium]